MVHFLKLKTLKKKVCHIGSFIPPLLDYNGSAKSITEDPCMVLLEESLVKDVNLLPKVENIKFMSSTHGSFVDSEDVLPFSIKERVGDLISNPWKQALVHCMI